MTREKRDAAPRPPAAAGRIGPARHADRRTSLEQRAAALRRRLHDGEARTGPTAPGGPAPPRRRRNRRLAWISGGAAVLVLGLVLALGQVLGRGSADTGRAASGRAPASARLDAMRTEVETESAPTARLLAFAHLAMDEGQASAAIWAYRRVLAREPGNAEALTHVGMILYGGGHVDEALARIDEALASQPRYAHALWDRAYVLLEGKRDPLAAARAFEAFLEVMPAGEDAARARQMLAEAKRRGAAATTPAAGPVSAAVRAPAPPDGSRPVLKSLAEMRRMMERPGTAER